jgi:Ku70/Ku80 beta-barrel domain
MEIPVKNSKCTALMRPKGWKKFGIRQGGAKDADGMDVDEVEREEEEGKVAYAQLKMRTEYYVDRDPDPDATRLPGEEDEEDDGGADKTTEDKENLEKVEKEELIRGFKYGTTYAPCPDGQFPRLNTRKGIDICGFFPAKNVCDILSVSLYSTHCVYTAVPPRFLARRDPIYLGRPLSTKPAGRIVIHCTSYVNRREGSHGHRTMGY